MKNDVEFVILSDNRATIAAICDPAKLESIYKVMSGRCAPTKLVLFTLSPDEAEALARQLLDQARQAREG